ncbi:MAG: omptin family outer membrane protease, partial [Treponema sp.]|nr:omptin family outer membrane protease [Treponema sp.]
MKSILRFVCFVSLAFAAVPPASGQIRIFGQDYGFSLSAGPGIMYGTSYEIVYRQSGSDDYLSELRWDIKPLYYLGLELELAPARPLERWGFFAALGARAALPMKTGTMEDRDWIHPSGDLNLFSSHDNYTTAAVMANIEAGFSL